jgi:hypothetical protein
MDALAGERVEIDRQRRDQRLAFAGLHLGDLALVQDHAADQLHVEMALAEVRLAASRTVAKAGTRMSSSVLPSASSFLNIVGARAQRLVGERLQLLLERVDGVDLTPLLKRPAIWHCQESAIARVSAPIAGAFFPDRRTLPCSCCRYAFARR